MRTAESFSRRKTPEVQSSIRWRPELPCFSAGKTASKKRMRQRPVLSASRIVQNATTEASESRFKTVGSSVSALSRHFFLPGEKNAKKKGEATAPRPKDSMDFPNCGRRFRPFPLESVVRRKESVRAPKGRPQRRPSAFVFPAIGGGKPAFPLSVGPHCWRLRPDLPASRPDDTSLNASGSAERQSAAKTVETQDAEEPRRRNEAAREVA